MAGWDEQWGKKMSPYNYHFCGNFNLILEFKKSGGIPTVYYSLIFATGGSYKFQNKYDFAQHKGEFF